MTRKHGLFSIYCSSSLSASLLFPCREISHSYQGPLSDILSTEEDLQQFRDLDLRTEQEEVRKEG